MALTIDHIFLTKLFIMEGCMHSSQHTKFSLAQTSFVACNNIFE